MLSRKYVIIDGAMGTMLQKEGLKVGERSESFNISNPEAVMKIHRAYAEAGADIITANTFGANELNLKSEGISVQEMIRKAVNLAKGAAGDKLVALDLGPTGQLLEPYGDLTYEEAYNIFAKQVKAGVEAGADVILIETMMDLEEAKAAILSAKENSTLPVLCTMTFSEGGRTLMGADAHKVAVTLQNLGVDALGANCSVGPKELMPVVEELLKYSTVPVIVQPNAGLPKLINGNIHYDITAQEFSSHIENMAKLGVKIFGGCCGTTPEFITEVKRVLEKIYKYAI